MTTAKISQPLQSGMRLKADEFYRRWEAMPHLKKVELINGVVYMPPMVSDEHGDNDSLLGGWLVIYSLATLGTRSSTNRNYRLDEYNAPQPDQSLRILPKFNVQALGIPELVLETAVTSVQFDLNEKRKLYEAAGVQEYIVAEVDHEKIHWFQLVEGMYQPVEPDEDSVYRSKVFPGLWLDADAVYQYDSDRFQTVMQAGLQSPEHREFVEKLQLAKKE